jgi:hypothetical protein
LRVDTPEKLARLQLDKGISSYEDQTLVADPAEITNSLAILGLCMTSCQPPNPRHGLTSKS